MLVYIKISLLILKNYLNKIKENNIVIIIYLYYK